VYDRVKSGVVRVHAGLGHGSGFMIDDIPGAVITNEHVIGGARNVSVSLDSTTPVPATVLAQDHDRDHHMSK